MNKIFSLIKSINTYDILILSIVIYWYTYYVGVIVLGKTILYYLLLLITCFTFIYALIFEYKKSNIRRNLYSYLDPIVVLLVRLLLISNVLIIIRGLMTDFTLNGFVRLFLYPRYMLFYICPLIFFLPITRFYLNKMQRWWFVSIFFSFIFTYLFRNVILVSNLNEINDFVIDEDLSFYNYLNLSCLVSQAFWGMAFFFIFNEWKSLSQKFFIYFSLIFSIILPMFLGRRGGVFQILLILSLLFILKLKQNKMAIFSTIVFFLIIIWLYNTYFLEIKDYFPILFDRLTDNTRSWAEQEFYNDFNDVTSIIIGRGSHGTYLSPTYGHRNIIETGYLDIMLHGGIINLLIYASILFISFLKGFFFSTNKLVNAMALYILAQLISLYPTSPIDFSLSQFSLWICVACCASPKLRNLKYFSLR